MRTRAFLVPSLLVVALLVGPAAQADQYPSLNANYAQQIYTGPLVPNQ